jgi:hypothetical protein
VAHSSHFFTRGNPPPTLPVFLRGKGNKSTLLYYTITVQLYYSTLLYYTTVLQYHTTVLQYNFPTVHYCTTLTTILQYNYTTRPTLLYITVLVDLHYNFTTVHYCTTRPSLQYNYTTTVLHKISTETQGSSCIISLITLKTIA